MRDREAPDTPLSSRDDEVLTAEGHAGNSASNRTIGKSTSLSAEAERRLHDLLSAFPIAIYTTDTDGVINFYNEAAGTLWAHRPTLGKAAWCGSWRLEGPDGTPLAHDASPMAMALKEDRPIKGAEAVAVRMDGTRVPFLAYSTPLRNEAGAPVGAVNMLIDITERKKAEEFGQRFSAIVESSDDAIISKSLNGIIATWNPGAERLFGYTASEMIGKSVTLLIPPERENEEPGIIDRIKRGQLIDHYETVRRRKDGSLIDISLTVSPIRNAHGTVIGASKIARDITGRKRAEEQQKLLLREMSHRIGNLFAVTSALVALSARSAQTPQEMAKIIRERLGALSRAHSLIRPDLVDIEQRRLQETTLEALIRAIFAPYEDTNRPGSACVIGGGPKVLIGENAITSIALVLHELATNSAKYGALSCSTGHVHIDWSVEAARLALVWDERGGPPIHEPPSRDGFGSMLANRSITDQLGGEVFYDWRPNGLIVRLFMPIAKLTR